MSSNDLGKNIYHHGSRNLEFARALVWAFGALVLGLIGTLIGVNFPGKGDPSTMLWLGIAVTAFLFLTTLLWLVPAMQRHGQAVEFFEKGIVVTRRGIQQKFRFADIKSVAEDIEYHPVAQEATRSHTLTMTSVDGRRVTLSAGAVYDFEILRDNLILGVTKALVPQLAKALHRGEDERVNLVLLKRDGILLDKTRGARGTLIPWVDLVDVSIHNLSGQVLLQTREGIIDTRALMIGIPLWFLLEPLARQMTKLSAVKT